MILHLTFVMKVVLIATLSRLCSVLGRFPYVHGHHDAKRFTSFMIYPCSIGTKLA